MGTTGHSQTSILCSYCDELAVSFGSSGPPTSRVFCCRRHVEVHRLRDSYGVAALPRLERDPLASMHVYKLEAQLNRQRRATRYTWSK